MMSAEQTTAPVHRPRLPHRWPFTLEKWYVDVLSDDGAVLILYFGRIWIFGRQLARFTADVFLPEGRTVSGHAAASPRGKNGRTLVFGPAVMEPDRIRWETPGLSGELRVTPRFPPAELLSPFFQAGDRTIRWNVEVPDADVEGVLRWNGGERRLTGRGYRDWVWLDIAPWRFPLDELRWGRAVCGSSAAVWVEAQTPESRIQARWLDGRAAGAEWPVELQESRTLLETSVVDLEGLKLSAFRPLVAALTGNPHEVKWSARARIGSLAGIGIHERVRWQRRRSRA